MSDIKLNDNWNLDISNGDLVLTTGLDSVRQNLTQRLRTFFAEWFLDTRVGVPYFEQIMVKNPNPLIAGNVFKNIIINTPGVLELTAFSLTIDSAAREATLSFSARTSNGTINYSEVLP